MLCWRKKRKWWQQKRQRKIVKRIRRYYVFSLIRILYYNSNIHICICVTHRVKCMWCCNRRSTSSWFSCAMQLSSSTDVDTSDVSFTSLFSWEWKFWRKSRDDFNLSTSSDFSNICWVWEVCYRMFQKRPVRKSIYLSEITMYFIVSYMWERSEVMTEKRSRQENY